MVHDVSSGQVFWLVEWIIFLLWFLPEKVNTEKLQPSLQILGIGRKLREKMVSIFLEKTPGFRKNQMTSQQGRKGEVALLYVSSPVALSQEDASFFHPHQVETHQQDPYCHVDFGLVVTGCDLGMR